MRYQVDNSLKLTVEGWGQTMPFLDCEVLISDGVPNIEFKFPVFHVSPGDCQPVAHKRLLDCTSPNAQRMLLSLVPTLVKKCAWSTHKVLSRMYVKFLHYCLKKGYPSNWWRPLLLSKVESIGLRRSGIQLARVELHQPWSSGKWPRRQNTKCTISDLGNKGIRILIGTHVNLFANSCPHTPLSLASCSKAWPRGFLVFVPAHVWLILSASLFMIPKILGHRLKTEAGPPVDARSASPREKS